jgi:hypothetical protein
MGIYTYLKKDKKTICENIICSAEMNGSMIVQVLETIPVVYLQ